MDQFLQRRYPSPRWTWTTLYFWIAFFTLPLKLSGRDGGNRKLSPAGFVLLKGAAFFGTQAGYPSGPISAIMAALYITQDSFGTACNISGDNAIGVVVDAIYKNYIVKATR